MNPVQTQEDSFRGGLKGGTNFRGFQSDASAFLRRFPEKNYYVVFFHLDQFRYLNELFGYENGTKVLIGIAGVLRNRLFEGELSAHLFADRFVLLLSSPSREKLTERLRSIFQDLKDSIEFTGIHYEMIPSVGIYECTDCRKGKTLSVAAMVNRAVIAAKYGGTGTAPISYYEDAMCLQMVDKNKEDRLHSAIENHEFLVYYQPKYSTQDRSLVGSEALVRWKTDANTIVPPMEYIPVFERDKTIPELDFYIFEQVCRDIQRWLKEGKKVVPVSVNLSRVSLFLPGTVQRYGQTARRYGVPVSLLELEVTESALAEDGEPLRTVLEQLHSEGFSLAVDDFGTGYSSLCMLGDLQADTLKLDRQFLNSLESNHRGRTVLEFVVGLAEKLRMSTVAEGVESEWQLHFLQEIHCAAVQGYLLSKPLPVGDYEVLLPEFASESL